MEEFNWYYSKPDIDFVKENELNNCVTEKIIRNKFIDPLISSESDDEKPKINWDEVFKNKKHVENPNFKYVAGLRAVPAFPKLSALTNQQHYQCLKVLCSENPKILPAEFIPRPTKSDLKLFQNVKEIYEKEQKEYIEWAKTLWINGHCVRVMRLKPIIENIYDAEFTLKAEKMQSYPNTYTMAAQIPLDSKGEFNLVQKNDLIRVNISDLPQVDVPEKIEKKICIIRPHDVPQPCKRHPCRFILPNEQSMSVLPLTELHRELGVWGGSYGASAVLSEKAVRCLASRGHWMLPLTVAATMGAFDGESSNVVVIGSDFSEARELPQYRSYRAYRHLLEFALIPFTEREKCLSGYMNTEEEEQASVDPGPSTFQTFERDSSDDEDHFVIDIDMDRDKEISSTEETMDVQDQYSTADLQDRDQNNMTEKDQKGGNEGNAEKNTPAICECTCQDTMFEKPPSRSFTKWQVQNHKTNENHDIIIHCSHKVRYNDSEAILEPILDYQLELGASEPSEDNITSSVVAMMLRNDAKVINARIEACNGELITIEEKSRTEILTQHSDVRQRALVSLHTALSQLQGLLPGNYVLVHEPAHGDNTMLYCGNPQGSSLPAPCAHSAAGLPPPALRPALLPLHKYRKILPCAFSPFPKHVANEQKKPVTRQKAPPQAIQWPRTSRRSRRKRNNR